MTKLLGKGARRLIASLAIWLVFITLLMTAVTQQSVSARIEKSASSLGYSGSLALVQDVKLRQDGLGARHKDVERWKAELEALNETEQKRQGLYNDSWDEAVPILERLSRESKCGIAFDWKGAVPYDQRSKMWGKARVCVNEHGKELPGFVVETFNKSRFPELRREALSAKWNLDRKKLKIAAAAAAEKLTDEETKAVESFRDADVLRAFFATRWLVDFPPPVLQLLLSASAGAFGALLITLILLVYPKTDLKFSTSGGFWERIMLGGFIAVCVYIVLLGGTAVLGTASFDQGGANYMTFCAISVLAGMFSDRVAHWLSSRADLFFKGEGRADPPPAP